MSMCASVLAIGPFSAEIADCLEYPAKYYANTRRGAIVVAELFQIVEGTRSSTDFAAHLGITDPWDFNQHKIDPGRIDVDGLKTFFARLAEGDDNMQQLARLLRLREYGFELIFRPNG